MDKRAFIGVGSNMGNASMHCLEAISRLLADDKAAFSAVSSFYSTSPVGPVPQRDFVNCAIAVSWGGSAHELLALLLRTERDMGRIRRTPKGPRVIDLDILLLGDLVLKTPDLIIPHPELHRRGFALVPCVEIDPSIVHPLYGKPLSRFLAEIDETQRVASCLGAREAWGIISGAGKRRSTESVLTNMKNSRRGL
jgi:2-amino-4-hydroxy-6-hydroxymethyldihydropteridine diphosphokinase